MGTIPEKRIRKIRKTEQGNRKRNKNNITERDMILSIKREKRKTEKKGRTRK